MSPAMLTGKTMVVRADADSRMGIGHVMRCLALAQAWQDTGERSLFLMAPAPPALKTRLLSEGMEVLALEASPGGGQDRVASGELFPLIGFVITNSRLPVGKVIKVYNGRAEIENRIKEGKNTLRWDKTSCQGFEANQARLKMGVLAYNLLHMTRQFYVWGEEVKRSMRWLIKRLIKVGARVSYHARRWYVHLASAFPLAQHYRSVLAWGA